MVLVAFFFVSDIAATCHSPESDDESVFLPPPAELPASPGMTLDESLHYLASCGRFGHQNNDVG
jgi:hypothetical protein